MNNESSQPSTPLNSAVDQSLVRVLRVLDSIARSSRCEYFLAGATARDLILVNVHGLPPGRATRDIDFGIAVENWAQFELLKERLLASNDFSASCAQQRMWVDRGRESNKDAADLYRLFTTYADAGNTDRLYDRELPLLETVDFGMRLAGAELLGRDVAAMCDAQILNQVQSVLAVERNRERLVIDMVRTCTYAEATPFVERTLSGFCRGLRSDGVSSVAE